MPLQIHDIEMVDGSNNSYEDRVVTGIKSSVVNYGSPGVISSVAVNTAGQYASKPTLSVSGSGSSAVLAPSMKVVAAAVVAAGTGYAPGNTITFTGGTASQQGIMTVVTSKLVSVALNAAGTGYAAGDDITLAGGAFTTAAHLAVASTKLISTAVLAAGTGYGIGDTITLAGGTFSSAAVLTVSQAKLISASLNAAGSGYAPGDTITLTGGTSSVAAIITVDTVSTGAIATFHVTTAGNYTVETATFTQASTSGIGTGATFNAAVWGVLAATVSGGSYSVNASSFTQSATSGTGTGATFNTAVWGINTVTIANAGVYQTNTASFTQGATSGSGTGATFQTAAYGVNTFSITNAGSYTVLPADAIAQGSTSGSGTGATFNVAAVSGWGVGTIAVSVPGTGYTSGSSVVFTGGTPVVAAVATITLGSQTGNAETIAVSFGEDANLPANYSVMVNPQQAVFWSVPDSSKTSTGFDVVLTPLAAATVAAGHIDVLVMG